MSRTSNDRIECACGRFYAVRPGCSRMGPDLRPGWHIFKHCNECLTTKLIHCTPLTSDAEKYLDKHHPDCRRTLHHGNNSVPEFTG
jgi:hypothetical protein